MRRDVHTQWEHSHDFNPDSGRAEASTRSVMILTALMMVVEIAAGITYEALGSDIHEQVGWILADTVAAMAGIRLTHVPYNKAPEAIQDVLGGRIDLICLPDAALSAYIANNQIKPLAVSTAQRVPNLLQVPSLSDTFPGFEYAGWNGLFAPANTPAEVVTRVNRDIQALLRQPEVVQRLAALGSIADSGMGTAAFATFMKAERERWAGIVKAIGIKAE
jgi:tripartite-type tricarboxylate transporter receptor subunit TctC